MSRERILLWIAKGVLWAFALGLLLGLIWTAIFIDPWPLITIGVCSMLLWALIYLLIKEQRVETRSDEKR